MANRSAKYGLNERGGSKSWTSYVAEYADELHEPMDDFFIPTYGIGHNSGRFVGNPDQVMRGETNGRMDAFIGVPRVDVDSHMALMLLLGINDSVTLRKKLTTKEAKIDNIDPVPQDNAIIDYMAQEISKGKTRTALVLRFPDTTFRGKQYKKGGTLDPNFVEMPVVIDLTAGMVKLWKDEEVGHLVHPEEGDVGSDPSDRLAQAHGFANARDMQNSRPLQLNNHWLKLNTSREADYEKELAFHQERRQKLTRKIAVAETKIAAYEEKIEELKTGQATNPEKQPILNETLERMKAAETKAAALGPIVESLLDVLNTRTEALNAFYQNSRALSPEERNTDSHKAQDKRLRQAVYEAHGAYVGDREAPGAKRLASLERSTKDAKIEGYEYCISGWQERLDKYHAYLEETMGELDALDNQDINTHRYAPTDHRPELLTLKVVAANPRAYKAQAENHLLVGRNKDIQDVYRLDIYPRALDNNSGWLRDALSGEPANHHLRASRRFFEFMHKQDVACGAFTGDFNDYVTRVDSPFHEYVDKISSDSLSDPMHAAMENERYIRPRSNTMALSR